MMKKASICLLAVFAVFMLSSSMAVADCPDKEGICWANVYGSCLQNKCGSPVKLGTMSYGTCGIFKCKPCKLKDYYREKCRETYSEEELRRKCNCGYWTYEFRDHDGSEIGQ